MAEKSNEWYTPARYIEAARLVMGSIDLDPASCELANQTVKASRYYSKDDNGLAQDWTCESMWLNPPYGSTDGSSNIGMFTKRLVHEYRTGNVVQAILLSTAKTCTSWFDLLWEYPICFTREKIYFTGDVPYAKTYNGKYSHIHGTIFVYLGPNEQKFINTFSQFGRIAKAIDTPRRVEKPIPLWDAERIYA